MSQHNGSANSPARNVARNMAELGHDMVTLGELQAQLAKAEISSWVRSFIWPTVLLGAALFVTLGCIPVLLLALAYVLVESVQWPHSLALLIAGVVGLAIAGIAGGSGLYLLKKNPALLEKSQEEFKRNLSWIKQVLKAKSNPPGACDPLTGGRTPVI